MKQGKKIKGRLIQGEEWRGAVIGAREALGWNQAKVAAILGVDRSDLGKWERGQLGMTEEEKAMLEEAVGLVAAVKKAKVMGGAELDGTELEREFMTFMANRGAAAAAKSAAAPSQPLPKTSLSFPLTASTPARPGQPQAAEPGLAQAAGGTGLLNSGSLAAKISQPGSNSELPIEGNLLSGSADLSKNWTTDLSKKQTAGLAEQPMTSGIRRMLPAAVPVNGRVIRRV